MQLFVYILQDVQGTKYTSVILDNQYCSLLEVGYLSEYDWCKFYCSGSSIKVITKRTYKSDETDR